MNECVFIYRSYILIQISSYNFFLFFYMSTERISMVTASKIKVKFSPSLECHPSSRANPERGAWRVRETYRLAGLGVKTGGTSAYNFFHYTFLHCP